MTCLGVIGCSVSDCLLLLDCWLAGGEDGLQRSAALDEEVEAAYAVFSEQRR